MERMEGNDPTGQWQGMRGKGAFMEKWIYGLELRQYKKC